MSFIGHVKQSIAKAIQFASDNTVFSELPECSSLHCAQTLSIKAVDSLEMYVAIKSLLTVSDLLLLSQTKVWCKSVKVAVNLNAFFLLFKRDWQLTQWVKNCWKEDYYADNRSWIRKLLNLCYQLLKNK